MNGMNSLDAAVQAFRQEDASRGDTNSAEAFRRECLPWSLKDLALDRSLPACANTAKDLPVLLCSHDDVKEQESPRQEQSMTTETSLSKALSIMNKGVPATGKERLELARPLFEEAVVNADLLIKSTIRKELRKVIEELEKLSSPEAIRLESTDGRKTRTDLESRAQVLFEGLRESGRARIEYAKVLNRIALELQDSELNARAFELLKTLQKKEPCFNNDAYVIGALQILQQKDISEINHDAAVKLGLQELDSQKKVLDELSATEVGVGIGAGAVVLAMGVLGALGLRNRLQNRKYREESAKGARDSALLNSAALEVQKRLPERLRRKLPTEFHPDVLEALDGMREVDNHSFAVYQMVNDYKSKKPGSVEKVNEFIARVPSHVSDKELREGLPKDSSAERGYASANNSGVPVEVRVERLTKPMKIVSGPDGVRCMMDVSAYGGIRILRGIPADELTAARVERELNNIDSKRSNLGPKELWDRYSEYRDTISKKFCSYEEARLRDEYKDELSKLQAEFSKCRTAVEREAFCNGLARKAIKAHEQERTAPVTNKSAAVGIIVSVKEGETVMVFPDGKIERTPAPSDAVYKTGSKSAVRELEAKLEAKLFPSKTAPDSEVEALRLQKALTENIDRKLEQIDRDIDECRRVGKTREGWRDRLTQSVDDIQKRIDVLTETGKELRRIKGDCNSKTAAELKPYAEALIDRFARAGKGVGGKAGTAVALLLVAGWLLESTAPHEVAISKGLRVSPAKK